jgi:saccharopine dehydrogenase-like NADP-dependent oxidoreductase
VPALSSAVVDRYVERFARLDSIEIGISSGARVPGLATVEGVFSYAGKPFQHWRDGSWATAYGWLGLDRYRFPEPLGARWLGTCDIPDLELFPKRYPTVRTVSFRAGFASGIGHLVLWALACGVRVGALPSLASFAKPLHQLSRSMEPIVSDQGGMFVRLQGLGADQWPRSLNWYLLARRNHGPHIPCGAAIALARKLIRGVKLPTGAMPCVGLLSLEEFLAPLHGLDIREHVE